MVEFQVTGVLVDDDGEPMAATVRVLPYGPDRDAEPGGSDVPGEPFEVQVGADGVLDVRLAAVDPYDPAPPVTSYELLVEGRPPLPLLAPAPREPELGVVHVTDLGADAFPGWVSTAP